MGRVRRERSTGVDLPPLSNLRFARSAERAAYEATNDDIEFFCDVKLVRLVIRASRDKGEPQSAAEDTAELADSKQVDTPTDDSEK